MSSFHLLSVSMCYILINVTQATSRTRPEMYTAISSIQPLIETQKKIITKLKTYIEEEEDKLNILSEYTKQYMQETNNTIISNTLNPMNAFILIKRTTKDLDAINKHSILNSEFLIKRVNTTLSQQEDLMGAIMGVQRVQEIYDIKTEDFVRGHFKDIELSTQMPADDCYELGADLYRTGDWKNGIPWFIEAYNMFNLDDDKEFYPFTAAHILNQISFGYSQQNNSYEALYWLKKLLEIKVEDKEDYLEFKNAIDHFEKFKYVSNHTQEKNMTLNVELEHAINENNIYKKVCNGEIKIPNDMAKRLKCSYLTERPFLKIAPIKVEQLHIDPDIFLFYDLIHDHECEDLKRMVLEKLKQSMLKQKSHNTEDKATKIRVCKSAWVDECELTDKLEQRVKDCTGLNLEAAELLQITNYGIGGNFIPHFDHFNDPVQKNTGRNRLSTLIFYMTDVSEGATIFPILGLKITPIRGSMLYFDNLLPTGFGDPRSLHAGCPVLQGDKWIAVKWIHSPGQELVRQCSREYVPEPLPMLMSTIYGYPTLLTPLSKKKK